MACSTCRQTTRSNAGRESKFEDAPVLEPRTAAEFRASGARPFEMLVDDVHAEHSRRAKQTGEPQRDLPRAATGIEDARLVGTP